MKTRRSFFSFFSLPAIVGLWFAVYFAALFTPPLLDDADATHAEAARAILTTGDWVTLHVDGIRYLEKAPLPYWLVALCFRGLGAHAFAAHLPGALSVLGLSLLAYVWGRGSFNERTGLYAALAMLTSAGVFLFTRVFIPDAMFSLWIGAAMYSLGQALAGRRAAAYVFWATLALAVLTKGFVALVLVFAAGTLFLLLTGRYADWRKLHAVTGGLLFLAIAAPWHILAAVRNQGGENGHGFAWFYFVNEHILRFLGRRMPHDYNKLSTPAYWLLHLVWLFPWSLFAPVVAVLLWRSFQKQALRKRAQHRLPLRFDGLTPRQADTLLLGLFAFVILFFFSLSTNQEYYTFPAYLPLLILCAAALDNAERVFKTDVTLGRTLLGSHILLAAIGVAAALVLSGALYASRGYARPADIGSLLAHRAVSNYTFSMASLFDLTGASFAALRLPAVLALLALALGPVAALWLRRRSHHLAATLGVALTAAVFLIAAHIALARFAPMLSSRDFADRIAALEAARRIAPDTEVLLFGDQAYGSSLPFYLDREVKLVDGRSTSLYFGSTFPDAPPIFLTPPQLTAAWGHGPRKLLFVPAERHDDALRVVPGTPVVVAEESGKLLLTDRPLDDSSQGTP